MSINSVLPILTFIRRYCPVIITFALLSGCTQKGTYTIKGMVNLKAFENRSVYLVPFSNPVAEEVDSAVIRNGSFEFTGTVDSVEVKILRIQAVWPAIIEQLLVVIEPGEIEVVMDTISSGGGTPLNAYLQQWKEKKQQFDRQLYEVQRSWRNKPGLSDSDETVNKNQQFTIDSLNKDFNKYNLEFLKSNIHNQLGIFIFNTLKTRMDSSEKQEIMDMLAKISATE